MLQLTRNSHLLHYFILFSILSFFAISCEKENTDDNPGPDTGQPVVATILEGSWHISLFREGAVDETASFSGFAFSFQVDGSAMAIKGETTIIGSWQSGTGDSGQKLILNFGPNDPWEELNEDWNVLEITDNRIQLEHVSGGDGSRDLLTFERN